MFAERRKNIEGNLSRCRERQKQQKRDEIKIEKRQTKENMKRNLNADSGPVSKYKDNIECLPHKVHFILKCHIILLGYVT